MRKQNGITLIALVISIIVMLILAGVSINAVIGDNGVLTRAQYSSFMNEMAAVEEAVQLWKAGELIESKGQVSTAIPTNGLCNVNELTATERLVGEIGFYRTWSINNTIPEVNILSSATVFNESFKSEFVFYPAGVQDLYYLNNEVLDLDEDKVYLIDAATSMVYSMSGITLNGVRCYSTSMAKAVIGGINTVPMFAEAEVSGTGNGESLAGNVQEEFLPDGTQNPNYNPNGFKLISNSNSNNIYKLYNNGELYAKGVKSVSLDLSTNELSQIDPYIWNEFKLPENISSYKKVLLGKNTIFVFTEDEKIYVYGNNSSNKLGLTPEEQKEYTGRTAIEFKPKDNENNIIDVKDIYCFDSCTFIIDKNNKVFACGLNTAEDSGNGSLGIGSTEEGVTKFYPCIGLPIGNIRKIEEDYKRTGINNTLVLYEDGSIYVAGATERYTSQSNTFNLLTTGDELDGKIIDIAASRFYYALVLTENGNVYKMYRKYQTNVGYIGIVFDKIDVSNIVELHSYMNHQPETMKDRDGNWYLYDYMNPTDNSACVGLPTEAIYDSSTNTYKTLINVNESVDQKMFEQGDRIKQIICSRQSTATYLYIMESGRIWASGFLIGMGLGSEYNLTSSKSVFDELTLIFDPTSNNNLAKGLDSKKIIGTKNNIFTYNIDSTGIIFLINEDGKVYITGEKSIMYLDNIINGSWEKIASNVKEVFVGDIDKIAYVDKEGNGYIAVKDLRDVGIDSISNSTLNDSNQFYKITSISDKIKKIQFNEGCCFVLTENGNLYSAGRDRYDTSWQKNAHTGFLPEKGAISELTLLDSNVSELSSNGNCSVIYTTQDEIKCFGALGFAGIIPSAWNEMTYEPVNATYLNEITDISVIKEVGIEDQFTYVLLNDGNIYVCGTRAQKLNGLRF